MIKRNKDLISGKQDYDGSCTWQAVEIWKISLRLDQDISDYVRIG